MADTHFLIAARLCFQRCQWDMLVAARTELDKSYPPGTREGRHYLLHRSGQPDNLDMLILIVHQNLDYMCRGGTILPVLRRSLQDSSVQRGRGPQECLKPTSKNIQRDRDCKLSVRVQVRKFQVGTAVLPKLLLGSNGLQNNCERCSQCQLYPEDKKRPQGSCFPASGLQ